MPPTIVPRSKNERITILCEFVYIRTQAVLGEAQFASNFVITPSTGLSKGMVCFAYDSRYVADRCKIAGNGEAASAKKITSLCLAPLMHGAEMFFSKVCLENTSDMVLAEACISARY